ncbi:hypothetical protein [Burkholderia stagnalis]
MRKTALIGVTLGACMLAGCAGYSEMQSSVANFDNAAHTAVSAEKAFLDAVVSVDCQAQFYQQALSYAVQPTLSFDLTSQCKPRAITRTQVELRNALLSAIAVYADKMQALSSTDSDKNLSGNATTLARSLNTFAEGSLHAGAAGAVATGVEAAIVSVAQFALDSTRTTSLKEAARNMQQPLSTIVATLKSENAGLAGQLNGSIMQLESALRASIANSAASRHSTVQDRIDYIVQARQTLANVNPLQVETLVGPDNGPQGTDFAAASNAALDALLAGNLAIAETGPAGVRAAASDLYRRAMGAKDLYTTISAAK